MNKEEQLQLIEESRQRMHQSIDARYDALVRAIENGEQLSPINTEPQKLPLSMPPMYFKGRKPLEVTFSDGRSIQTPTWKSVATTILRDCNHDSEMRDKMLSLRGYSAGRLRYILSSDPDELNVPLKIDEGLYFEGKFDTEYLIKMMTEKVLKPLGYPYRDITVTLRPEQSEDLAVASEKQDEGESANETEDEGFSMQMM